MVVVAEASSADQLVTCMDGTSDVALVDHDLGGRREGLWAARQLTRRRGGPRVLIHSASVDGPLAAAALVAGADGLIATESLGAELCCAVRRIAKGGWYPPSLTRSVAQLTRSRLHHRDRAILAMLLAGLESDEIAQRLMIGPRELDERRGTMLLALAPTPTIGAVPWPHEPSQPSPTAGRQTGTGR